jgi:hypothetical protein
VRAREDHLQSNPAGRIAAILLLALATRAGAESGPPVPGNVTFKGLSGSVSTDQSLPGFSEALISLHYLPTGGCPRNGEVYDRYDQIAANYPADHKLASFIVKNANGGVSTVPTQFMLPAGMPISNCAFVMLDGSILTGDPFTMRSDMTLAYSIDTPSPAPRIIGLDDEFCFGQSWGCQIASVDTSQSFANVVPIQSPVRLLALYGNISDSTFTPGGRFAPAPDGAWSTSNDFYAIKSCSGIPKGIAGPGDFYSRIPAGSINLLNVTMRGNGSEWYPTCRRTDRIHPSRLQGPETDDLIPADRGQSQNARKNIGPKSQNAVKAEYPATWPHSRNRGPGPGSSEDYQDSKLCHHR